MIVFTYQGDGDLASIGMSEIVHAANRGEKFTTIFVNNAIYGMTGGQMAPTTMPGQVTTTSPTAATSKTPAGRSACASYSRHCALLAISSASRFTRHRISSAPRRAIRTAFQYQVDGRCFSLVEVLSTCPTNWGLTPSESTEWVETNMSPYYPLGVFKTPEPRIEV